MACLQDHLGMRACTVRAQTAALPGERLLSHQWAGASALTGGTWPRGDGQALKLVGCSCASLRARARAVTPLEAGRPA